MRLIDADVLGRYLNDWQLSNAENDFEGEYSLIGTFMHILDTQPAVDAVPVVRCKDCIHRRTMGRPPFVAFVCSHNKGLGDNVKDDDFCSYGEKKEDRHN